MVGPARPGDIQHSVADVTLAREALGFAATTPLDLAMRETVAWFRGAGGRNSRGDLPHTPNGIRT